MAQENKKTPYLYIPLNLKETIEELNDEESGKIFKAIFQYANDGKVEKFNDRYLKLVFLQFKKNQDDNVDRYKKICEQNRKNVLQRWHPEKTIENKGQNTNDTSEYDGIQAYTDGYERIRIIPNKNKKEKKIKNKNKIKIENKNKINKKEKVVKKKNVADADVTTTTDSFYSPFYSFNDILEVGKKNNINADYCKKFYDYYDANNWETMKGEKIVDVEKLLKKWYREDKKKQKAIGFISNEKEAIDNDTQRIFGSI